MDIKQCVHCGREFRRNPRVRNHEYCSHKECQKSRRARWQRQKMARDADYRDNQKRCHKQWQRDNRDYYKNYRTKHPDYVNRNRLQQFRRDARRRKNGPDLLAKMDSLTAAFYPRKGRLYRLVPEPGQFLAKMDSLNVKLIPVNRL